MKFCDCGVRIGISEASRWSIIIGVMGSGIRGGRVRRVRGVVILLMGRGSGCCRLWSKRGGA
jgi:hypothetical protein